MTAEEEEQRERDQEKLRQETTLLRGRGKHLDREEQEAMEEMQTVEVLPSDDTVTAPDCPVFRFQS